MIVSTYIGAGVLRPLVVGHPHEVVDVEIDGGRTGVRAEMQQGVGGLLALQDGKQLVGKIDFLAPMSTLELAEQPRHGCRVGFVLTIRQIL